MGSSSEEITYVILAIVKLTDCTLSYMHDMTHARQRNYYSCSKSAFSLVTSANLITDPDKILQAYSSLGRTGMSRVKILAPWAKGAQMGRKGAYFGNG